MGHVSEGRSGALSEEEVVEVVVGFSNLRGEMNGDGSCGETGEESDTKRRRGGRKKHRRQMQRNVRERESE